MSLKPLELESRKKLYELIRQNPGLHYRELERRSGFISGMLEYHLHYLENEQLITVTMEKGYTRYFIKDAKLTVKDKRVISYLRQELPRGMILYIIMNENSTQEDISLHFSVSRPTMSYHLKRLEQDQVIATEKVGRKKMYSVLNPERVVQLIIIFRSSFMDVIIDAFLKYWYSRN